MRGKRTTGKHCYQFFWSKSQVRLPVPTAFQELVDLLARFKTYQPHIGLSSSTVTG